MPNLQECSVWDGAKTWENDIGGLVFNNENIGTFEAHTLMVRSGGGNRFIEMSPIG